MTFLPDIDHVAAIIRDVATTIVLPHFHSLAPTDIREKDGPLDLVTIADVASERALSERLSSLAPGSLIVGEEAVSADASLLDRLDGAAPVWVIDPIDGTYNFATGNPAFGMMIAYVRNGRSLASWIYDPCRDRMATATAGAGVFIDGRSPHPAVVPTEIAAVKGALSRRYCDETRRHTLDARARLLKSASQPVCSAQDYLRLLTGQIDFSFYNRALPWDHAAGTLMVAEAGGGAGFLDGTPYGPAERRDGLLVVAQADAWDRLRTFLAD